MSRITLELTHSEAEDAIQTLFRGAVLLDRAQRETPSPVERGACLAISSRLRRLAERLEAETFGQRQRASPADRVLP